MSPREVAIINFRDDSTKIPFLDDTVFLGAFTDIKEGLHSLGVVDVANFYSEGEYGDVYDWKADKTGSAILDSDLFAGRSDIQERVSVWRDVFEGLLKEYSGDNLRSIEKALNDRGGVRGSDNEASAGKGSEGDSKYRVGTAEALKTELPFTVEPDGSVRLFHWGKDAEVDTVRGDSTPKYRVSDREYIDAVEPGDMETAQQIMDEAIKEAEPKHLTAFLILISYAGITRPWV